MAGITMSTYLIIIFIVFVIINKSRKQNRKNISDIKKEQVLNEYYKKVAAQSGNVQSTAGMPSGTSSYTAQRPAAGIPAPGNMSANNVVAGKANMPSNSAANTAPSSDGKSTTEYLTEKAKRDQVEHAKEKFEERKSIQKKYGNHPVGGRYLLGDPIPRGMRLSICPYCGAENLVDISYHGEKDCYFCRTKLTN